VIEGEPSQTALEVAAARAAHLRYDPTPLLLEDDRAEALLGAVGDELIPRYSDDGPWILQENRRFLPFRARYAEDRLAEAYAGGTRQLVVLGAGLDSYAFRRPETQVDLRIYEVDHPSTQAWKVARIAELGWDHPVGLEFVACDFEKSSASEMLRCAGFASNEPAFVTWLGVVYYLRPETARAALVELAELLAPGSEVVIDYMLPLEDQPQRYKDLHATMATYLASVGEPQDNRHRPARIRSEILAAGFSSVRVEERDVLFERYFSMLDSRIPMSARFGMAVARR